MSKTNGRLEAAGNWGAALLFVAVSRDFMLTLGLSTVSACKASFVVGVVLKMY